MPRGKRTYDTEYFLEWLRNRNSNYMDFENTDLISTNLTEYEYMNLIKARDLKRFIRRIERLLAYTDPRIHPKIPKRKLPKNITITLYGDKISLSDNTANDYYNKSAIIIPSKNELRLNLISQNGRYQFLAKLPIHLTKQHYQRLVEIAIGK